MQKYFEEQPTTRPEQVAVIKTKLKARFMRRYPTLDRVPRELICYNAKDPYVHAMMQYENMELFRFIRLEDNSLVGFRTRCPASFYNEPEIVTVQPPTPQRVAKTGVAAPVYFLS